MTDFDNNLRLLMMRANKARKQILHPYFAQIGLTFGQGHARILECLLAGDHITQKELADLCRMDVTTMSRSLDRLEEAGYLVRKRDPDSRRSFLVCITPEGVLEAKKVRKGLDFIDGQMIKGLTDHELLVFQKCLRQVCENLENCQTEELKES